MTTTWWVWVNKSDPVDSLRLSLFLEYLTKEVEILSVVQLIVATVGLRVTVGADETVGALWYLPYGLIETVVEAADCEPALSTALSR